MVFACQKDSFCTTYSSPVLSCVKSNEGDDYEVICEDTILFPEGGGQPCDTGFLDDIPVSQVLRRGAEAVHFVKHPLPIGKEVNQRLNWDRRFDHMQQHSGQHLITAIINKHYKIDTTSWWLGGDVSHIELDTKSLSKEQIDNIEKLSNDQILEQVPVKVKMCNPGDPDLVNARTRGLPDDVVGPIRIVEIVGLEDDLCCGTHVNNLVQLQAIKLLYAEKGKKNKTNLFFLAGGRILKYLEKSLDREQKLTKLLNNEPDQHVELISKLQTNLKVTSKKLSNTLKKVATEQGLAFLALNPRPKYYFNHCKEAEQDFIETFYRAVRDDADIAKTLLLLSVGENCGVFTLYGSQDVVASLGPKIAELLGGKGVAHAGKFQAKGTRMNNLDKAYKLVETELL